MATDSWAGVSADWSSAADWSGGLPSSTTTCAIGGSSAYLLTLTGSGTCAALSLTDPAAELYLSGALTLGGAFALQAGTFALAGGALDGGTLAMQGGTLLAEGGEFNGVTVDGPLSLSQANETLFVQNGLGLTGASGHGTGSLSIAGAFATVDFIGSQSLGNDAITLGASQALGGPSGPASLQITHAAGATAGATLTLGASVSVRDTAGQAQLVIGTVSPGVGQALPDALVNSGVIAASNAGASLTVTGSGTLINAGTLAVSNGALLTLACQGLQNTGVISVSNASLAFGGSFAASTLSSLGSVSVTGGSVSLTGTANVNGGTLNLGTGSAITASLGALALDGEIVNGTVADAGGGLAFASSAGTLDGVTYQGTLALTAAGAGVTLADGSSVTGGSIAITGSGATLLLQGNEALNGVTIVLGATSGLAALGTTDAFLASTATTAVLGPQTVLRQAGQVAALQANGFSPFAGIGLDDTLENQGIITAGIAGGTLAISGYGSVINQGSIAVSGGETLLDSAGLFANTGTLSVAAGSVAVLGAPSGVYGLTETWSNSGLLAASGGTLVLQGNVTTAQMGSLSETGGGVVDLAGTLTNTGATLTLGAAAGLTDLALTGTINGGTILDSGAALSIGASGSAMLQSLTDQGTLSLAAAGATLLVQGGLVVNGALRETGAGAALDFVGSQSLACANIQVGASSGAAAVIDVVHNFGAVGPSVLTLGAADVIVQSGQFAAIGTAQQMAGDSIVSRARITATTLGGTFTLGGQSFTNQGTIAVSNGDTLAIAAAAFSNAGAVTISNATLLLAGQIALANLGQLNLYNATLSVSGTFALGGGTLAIGAGSVWGLVSLTGTLAGGIVSDGGGGLQAGGGATLAGVTYQGTLDLSRPFACLAFSQGLSVVPQAGLGNGSILLTGAQARLIASSSGTLDACTVTIGSPVQTYGNQRLNPPELAAAAGVQLTLGPAAVVNAVGAIATLGDCALGNWTDSLVNDGAINDAVAGCTLTLNSTQFTNAGTLAATHGSVLWLSDVLLQNSGTLALGSGAVVQLSLWNYFSAPRSGATVLSNSGVIALSGGTLHEMNANGLFPGVPVVNTASGQITGTGALITPVSNAGIIEALGGALSVQGTVSGTGSLLVGQGATLDLTSAVLPGQTVDFTSASGTLMLNQPGLFAGTIENFAQGDVIDLPGQALTSVAISNGVLALNTPTQQLFIGATAPLAGALMAGADGHGGTAIAYLPKSGTGTAMLAVSQPNMLFWTTPSGDLLQGSTGNMRGADLCNWSNNSSLDLTDLNPGLATLTASESGGFTTLTATDGTHACSVLFHASIAPSLFQAAPDGHGGTMITT